MSDEIDALSERLRDEIIASAGATASWELWEITDLLVRLIRTVVREEIDNIESEREGI